MKLRPGRTLLGENGSSKSTFLKLLAGFERKAWGRSLLLRKKIIPHKLLKKSYLLLLCKTVLAKVLLMKILKQNPDNKQKVAKSLWRQLGLEKECAAHLMEEKTAFSDCWSFSK